MKIETNSKLVKPGDTFVALTGVHYDGHDFIDEAIQNGAQKIIGEKKLNIKDVKYKQVKSARKYLTKICAKENKILTKNMKIIAITGTKGKSTTAMITYELLKKANYKVAYIGTLGLYYENSFEKLENTTPDILALNKIFKKLVNKKITHVIMEISSHSLVEKRIKGLKFTIAAFTNFSQDHLDYHLNMQNYFKAKMQIFKYLEGIMVVNNDDEKAKEIIHKTKKYVTIGTNGDFKINDYKLYIAHTLVNFEYHYNHFTVATRLVGKHNIYNYLMAIAICINQGIDIYDLINYTNNIKNVKGRNELIKASKGYAIIDYAHSPSAVLETLKTYNELKKNRIITIIGCGGQRDKTKRPIMGQIAVENSDFVIFTSDNPRDENPLEILKDITGNLVKKNYEVIENRSLAIKKGVKLLQKDDYLLILGKGHEDYQIIKNIKYHFDDKEEVLKNIKHG